MAKRHNWTRAEDDVLETWYGLITAEQIARRVTKVSGIERTKNAVVCRAGALRLDYRTAQDGISVADAARELAISPHVLYPMIAAGKVKVRGRGHCRLISFEGLEQLRAIFPQPPERSTTVTKARKRLGYSDVHFLRLLHAGVIRAVKRGSRWYVDADQVEKLAKEMRQSGRVRLDLSSVRALDEERAKTRAYGIEIRNKRRALVNAGVEAAELDELMQLPVEELERRLEETRARRSLLWKQLYAIRGAERPRKRVSA